MWSQFNNDQLKAKSCAHTLVIENLLSLQKEFDIENVVYLSLCCWQINIAIDDFKKLVSWKAVTASLLTHIERIDFSLFLHGVVVCHQHHDTFSKCFNVKHVKLNKC